MWIKEFEDGLLVTNESLDTNHYDQLCADVEETAATHEGPIHATLLGNGAFIITYPEDKRVLVVAEDKAAVDAIVNQLAEGEVCVHRTQCI